MAEPIFDTAIWIDHLRGRTAARTLIRDTYARGGVDMHAYVAAEILQGVLNKRELTSALAAISDSRLLVPTDHDWRTGVRFFTRHGLAKGVGMGDCLIAATAIRLGRPVVTLNDKHFRVFATLKVSRPY